mmetsp:Transcript_34461/g.64258  ORF Transcript_34461/g.64258 Transcript_34461/m.64258 type:complete len:107 (-) Transcript_34461:200-520(-)
MAGISNVCRCICGDHPKDNTTILVSSAHGCQDCNPALCLQHFRDCTMAQTHGGAVTVHCINRTAFMPRFAIGFLIFVVLILVVAALNKDRSQLLRRVYDWVGQKDA